MDKLDKVCVNMPMGSGLLRNKRKLKSFLRLDNGKAHPPIDSFLRFFKRLKDNCSPIAVPLTFSSSRPSRFPRFFGRLERFWQPFRSNWISFLRSTTDAWILDSPVQLLRITFSRFKAPLRSGISINFWEWLRSMSFNSFKICFKPINN